MGVVRSDIVGLRGLHRPLQFLGLFNCDNASHFAELPAEQVIPRSSFLLDTLIEDDRRRERGSDHLVVESVRVPTGHLANRAQRELPTLPFRQRPGSSLLLIIAYHLRLSASTYRGLAIGVGGDESAFE
jgi:hypothetical protein